MVGNLLYASPAMFRSRYRLFLQLLTVFVLTTGSAFLSADLIIRNHPLNKLDLDLGINVSLSVDAESTTTNLVQYQWFRNGVLINGATNATLHFLSVDPTKGGSYRAFVTDGQSTLMSSTARLT